LAGSSACGEIPKLLPGLRGDMLYSQVPALSAGDRGLLDLLTLDPTTVDGDWS